MKETVVVRRRRNPAATLRLICLGFCGGGAASYLDWESVIPTHVELAAICYPGREGRFVEGYAEDWSALTEDAVAAVLSATDLPYVLFGHSMGGWMAFDVTARIERDGGRLPQGLTVSSANAPSRGLTARDMFPSSRSTDQELCNWISRHGLAAEHVLANEDLRDMALELMRADIKVRDTFFYEKGTQVSVPLQVLTGASDVVIEPKAGAQWGALTRGTFRHDELPGGHFYISEVWRTLPKHITALFEGYEEAA